MKRVWRTERRQFLGFPVGTADIALIVTAE